MLAVGLIAFSLFRFVGDPVTFMLGQEAPQTIDGVACHAVEEGRL